MCKRHLRAGSGLFLIYLKFFCCVSFLVGFLVGFLVVLWRETKKTNKKGDNVYPPFFLFFVFCFLFFFLSHTHLALILTRLLTKPIQHIVAHTVEVVVVDVAILVVELDALCVVIDCLVLVTTRRDNQLLPQLHDSWNRIVVEVGIEAVKTRNNTNHHSREVARETERTSHRFITEDEILIYQKSISIL